MTPLSGRPISVRSAPSWPVHIFVAGDVAAATEACRAYCAEFGLCVTVHAANYVYTGGMESGVIVGLINYPRFPAEREAITERALDLARLLIARLHQTSASVQTPTDTYWLSRREGE